MCWCWWCCVATKSTKEESTCRVELITCFEKHLEKQKKNLTSFVRTASETRSKLSPSTASSPLSFCSSASFLLAAKKAPSNVCDVPCIDLWTSSEHRSPINLCKLFGVCPESVNKNVRRSFANAVAKDELEKRRSFKFVAVRRRDPNPPVRVLWILLLCLRPWHSEGHWFFESKVEKPFREQKGKPGLF
jgi:hypothetical protein